MQKNQLLLGGKILSYYKGSLGNKQGVLVFLHGWMQDGKSFEAIFEILEEQNIPYVSLDLPGFGGSALRHGDMSVEEYGDIAVEFIEKLGLLNPVLVGHSFGGRISIYLGSFYKNVEKIVLIGAAGIAPKMNPMRLLVVKIGKGIFSLPGLSGVGKNIKKSVSASDYTGAGKMTQIYRNTISNDLQHYMQNITIPTLMVWGKEDDQVTVEEAKIMHKHMINSDLHVLEGTHFIHQEKAQQVCSMILDFIKK
ncbi:alpha/beta hydrolase [Candidatus Gracilibacteria bacterium]|nr:alpha/beta hydrolase [Candidatus Gracilibacteria bacterium]